MLGEALQQAGWQGCDAYCSGPVSLRLSLFLRRVFRPDEAARDLCFSIAADADDGSGNAERFRRPDFLAVVRQVLHTLRDHIEPRLLFVAEFAFDVVRRIGLLLKRGQFGGFFIAEGKTFGIVALKFSGFGIPEIRMDLDPFPAFLADRLCGFLKLRRGDLRKEASVEDKHAPIAFAEKIASYGAPGFLVGL